MPFYQGLDVALKNTKQFLKPLINDPKKNQNQNYIEINTFLSFLKQIKTSAQDPLGFSLSKRFTMSFPISKL
jgi:hypothetical protein